MQSIACAIDLQMDQLLFDRSREVRMFLLNGAADVPSRYIVVYV